MTDKIALIKTTIVDVLVSLAGTTGPSPRSMIYVKVGMDLTIANTVQDLMVENGWIIATAETIRITAAGRELVQSAISEVKETEKIS